MTVFLNVVKQAFIASLNKHRTKQGLLLSCIINSSRPYFSQTLRLAFPSAARCCLVRSGFSAVSHTSRSNGISRLTTSLAAMNSVSEEAIEIASDFVSRDATPRKSARLSSALLDYSRPEGINLVPLGSSCGLDLFARLHNGARRELIDLYNMVDSMQRRVEKLRTNDLKAFFVWWDLFSSYLEVTFDCHEEVLWKMITKKTQLPDALNSLKREEMKKSLSSMLQGFDTIYSQMSRRPPDETMAKIIKSLVSMHPIVEYLESIESCAPEVIEENYKARDVRKFERQVASFIHKTGDADFRKMHLQVMTRAMTEEVLSAWQKSISPFLRFSYRSSTKRFTTTHLAAVLKLAVERQ